MMLKEITIPVEDDLFEVAQEVAATRGTTVEAMLEDFLTSLSRKVGADKFAPHTD